MNPPEVTTANSVQPASSIPEEALPSTRLNLVDTFADPGVFPKVLVKIGYTLVFLDLASVVDLSCNGQHLPVAIYGWYLDEDLNLLKSDPNAPDFFPDASEKPHTGERLLFVMSIGASSSKSYSLHGLRASGVAYNNSHQVTGFGPYAVSNRFIVWKMSDRHKHAIAKSNRSDSDSSTSTSDSDNK